ncbi:GFA family protein [Vibrio fluvialis]|nr:GFA family protein [Vibrio fluvialis]
MNRQAECCCGEIVIATIGDPHMHGICHCADCQKRTGSAFGISAYFNNDQVLSISGNAKCYSLHNSELNHDQERYFCPNCGSTLYWYVSTMPNVIGISGGNFTKYPLPEPTYSANHANKCLWVDLPSGWKKGV